MLSVVFILASTHFIFPDQTSINLVIEAFTIGMIFGFYIYTTLSFFTLLRYVVNKTPLNIELKNISFVEIVGKNEKLLIPINNLLYIKSEGHYINIFYLLSENHDVKNILFRENISSIQKKTDLS